jgi:hypothetical protein
MTESISSNKHSMVVGENAKMLSEQIEEEKVKIVSEGLPSQELPPRLLLLDRMCGIVAITRSIISDTNLLVGIANWQVTMIAF